MNASFKTRPATADDVAQIIALYRHLSVDDQSPAPDLARATFDRFMQIPDSAILLGEDGGQLVASCVVVVVPNLSRYGRPYALIENVVTHAAHRQRGFGMAVLDAACDWAWGHGCYKVMLMTGSRRPETLRFYAKAGFAQTKTGFQKRVPDV